MGEIGCIYSAQGFEFHYCGVILGNDLVWRDDDGDRIASKDASFDNMIRTRKHTPESLTLLLQYTYRVLLTRGMKGTFIYSTDFETRLRLHELVKGGASRGDDSSCPPVGDSYAELPSMNR